MLGSKADSDFFQQSCHSLPFEASASGGKARTDVPQVVNRDVCIH